MVAAPKFNATMTGRPLWANLHGHPSIWIRWARWNEELVESEQSITFGNRHIGVETIGRVVLCGKYGTWMIGDWRPVCGTCLGTRQVLMTAGDEAIRGACVAAIVDTLDAGLLYMTHASVECPDCRPHPGWVVG